MLQSVDVDTDQSSNLRLIHGSLLVEQPWSHEVSALEHELESPFVGSEARVHIGVSVDGPEGRHAVLLGEDEVVLLVDDDVLCLVVVSPLQLVDHNFGFFGEDDFDLFFWEVGPLE